MPADNQDVIQVSGLSRLCSSIVCAVIFAPMLLLGSLYLLGFNEQRAVCDARAIDDGRNNVKVVGCQASMAPNGELVLFSCPLIQDGLSALTFENTDFDATVLSVKGTGLRVEAEMLQCVEKSTSTTTKDNVGGGTTTVVTYTYSPEWSSTAIDSSAFKKKSSASFQNNCGAENPAWPAQVPRSSTVYAPSVLAGSSSDPYELPVWYVQRVPLDQTVVASITPAGWTATATGYTSAMWMTGASGIGSVRLSIKTNNWATPVVTALGENVMGTMARWTASDSWLCSGFTLQDLRMGVVSESAIFASLQAEASSITVLLRIVGFLLAWFAFSRMFGPLEVAADCIPCVGKYIGDAVACITCIVACVPACGCSLLVIGIVWVAMRPLVGIPLMLIALSLFGYMAYRAYVVREERKEEEEKTRHQTTTSGDGEAIGNANANEGAEAGATATEHEEKAEV